METKLFKAFLLTAVLGTITQYASAACTINLAKKTTKAKTAYVEGVSISQKAQNALSKQCKLNFSVMTQVELIAMETAAFKRKIERLKKK